MLFSIIGAFAMLTGNAAGYIVLVDILFTLMVLTLVVGIAFEIYNYVKRKKTKQDGSLQLR